MNDAEQRAAAAEARKTRLQQRVAEAAASSSTRGNGSASTSLETRRSRAALRLAEVTSRTAATLERLGRETAELAKRKAELEKERAEMAEENATLTDHDTRASKRRNQTREHEALLRAYLGDALDGVVADVSARRRAAAEEDDREARARVAAHEYDSHEAHEVRATAVAYPKTSDETEFRVTTGLNFEQLLDDACTYFGVARKGGQHSGHKGDGWRMALIDPVTGDTWLGSWTVAEEMARLEEESEAGSTTAAAKGGRKMTEFDPRFNPDLVMPTRIALVAQPYDEDASSDEEQLEEGHAESKSSASEGEEGEGEDAVHDDHDWLAALKHRGEKQLHDFEQLLSGAGRHSDAGTANELAAEQVARHAAMRRAGLEDKWSERRIKRHSAAEEEEALREERRQEKVGRNAAGKKLVVYFALLALYFALMFTRRDVGQAYDQNEAVKDAFVRKPFHTPDAGRGGRGWDLAYVKDGRRLQDGGSLVDHRGDSWPVDARDTNALPGEDADAGLYARTVETAEVDDGKGGGKEDGGGAADGPDFDDDIDYTTTKTFDGIDSAEDFWAWLEGPFVDSLTGATKYKTGNRVETPLAQRTQLHQEGHVDDVTAAYRFSDNDPRSAISDARLRVPVRTGGFDSSKVPRDFVVRTIDGELLTPENDCANPRVKCDRPADWANRTSMVGTVQMYNTIVGPLRLRQLRARETGCKWDLRFLYGDRLGTLGGLDSDCDDPPECTEGDCTDPPVNCPSGAPKDVRCYGEYSINDSEEPFGWPTAAEACASGPGFNHTPGFSVDGTNTEAFLPTAGTFHGAYPAGGFNVDVAPADLDDARIGLAAEIDRLRSHEWVDVATRAIIIKLTLYNANYHAYTYCQFLVEFSATGAIAVKHKLRSFHIKYYGEKPEVIVLEVLVFLLMSVQIIKLVRAYRHEVIRYKARTTWQFISSGVFWIDIAVVFTYIGATGIRLNEEVRAYIGKNRDLPYRAIDGELKPLQEFEDFSVRAAFYYQSYGVDTVTVVFLWAKLFSFLHLNPIALKLWALLNGSVYPLFCFLAFYTQVLCGFAAVADRAFGGTIHEFSGFTQALYTLLLLPYDMNAPKIVFHLFAEYPGWGPPFVVLYTLFVVLILSNLGLAIICENHASQAHTLEMRRNAAKAAAAAKKAEAEAAAQSSGHHHHHHRDERRPWWYRNTIRADGSSALARTRPNATHANDLLQRHGQGRVVTKGSGVIKVQK